MDRVVGIGTRRPQNAAGAPGVGKAAPHRLGKFLGADIERARCEEHDPARRSNGSGEAREGGPSYEGRIIRRGDQSPEGMREKARFVLGAMELRMTALGFGWADVTATQVYTIFDIHPLLPTEIVRRGASPGGLTWHFARPPVQGLDFEVDVRAVAHELVI